MTIQEQSRSTKRPAVSLRLAFSIAVLVLLFVLITGPAGAAQTYRFAVPELRLQAYIQPDASALLVYDITFANTSFDQSIDIVDIGTPHRNYDIGNMRASINGVDLTDIRKSEFVDPGVEIHLFGQAIRPGNEGTLHFELTMPDMVYLDTTNDENASFQITPTWFEDEFVTGSSNIWVLVHLLPDIHPDEVLFQDVPFSDKVIFEDHVVAVWRWPDGRATGSYNVGVSFPRRGMTRVIEQSVLDLAIKWLEDNPNVRLVLGGISVLLLGIAFFRFSGGTGVTVFVILGGGLVFLLYSSVASVFLALPAMALVFGLNEMFLSGRKKRYLPAIAQVEGGGIKRGLTAPEAAILLELPLNKVLTLILFGLLEKRVIRAVSHDPLAVEVNPEYRTSPGEERRKKRHEVAQRLGVAVRKYEHAFLDVLEDKREKTVQEMDFSGPMKELIQHTADRIKGFDLSDTQEYYRKIIQRALREAKSIGDIPEREQFLDRHMQWLLLDDAYPTVFRAPNYNYRPVWVRPFASSDRIGIPSGSSKSAGPAVGGRTSFTDVAASFAGWTENTMGKLADAIAPGALQVRGDSGLVNLGGVDKVTGDIFKALATSSGGSGGSSGGGCACACAGCACACACAGGGR